MCIRDSDCPLAAPVLAHAESIKSIETNKMESTLRMREPRSWTWHYAVCVAVRNPAVASSDCTRSLFISNLTRLAARRLPSFPTPVPVSYTHLDVYKRQGKRSVCCKLASYWARCEALRSRCHATFTRAANTASPACCKRSGCNQRCNKRWCVLITSCGVSTWAPKTR